MMPELGKYAGAVLSSYAVSLGLIILLVLASVLRARKVKAELSEIKERQKRG